MIKKRLIKTSSENEEAMTGLLRRLLPTHARAFRCESLQADSDVFELETVDGQTVIRGNTANSMAVGLHHYLRYYCRTSVSWNVDNPLEVPDVLPAFAGHVPAVLKKHCPDANIKFLGHWGGFDARYRSSFLDPLDPLFMTIAADVSRKKLQIFLLAGQSNMTGYCGIMPLTNLANYREQEDPALRAGRALVQGRFPGRGSHPPEQRTARRNLQAARGDSGPQRATEQGQTGGGNDAKLQTGDRAWPGWS